LLAVHWENGALQVRDLRTGQKLLTLPRPDKAVPSVVWGPDARSFVTLEDKRFARVWDAATGRLRCELEHETSVWHIAFSADGRFLALGGIAGALRVWDLTTNRQTMAVAGHGSNVQGLALSPDGQRLAAASSDCTTRLWDTRTGHEVLTLRTQLHEHSPLAFSPDGADLVSVNLDNRLQIWSTRGEPSSPAKTSP
jgi:WD40 repeat protein